MAEIKAPQSVTRTSMIGGRSGGPGGDPYGGRKQEKPTLSAEEIRDRVSLLGIPPESLTPQIEEALHNLIAEIAEQHDQLEARARHEDHLQSLVDHHDHLPLLNQRGFRRQMSQTLTHVRTMEASCVLLDLHVVNLERLARKYPRAAIQKALAQGAETIGEKLQKGDLLGTLDGFGFVVLLPLKDARQGQQIAAELVDALRNEPAQWNGATLVLEVTYGLHASKNEESLDDVIDGAEADLRIKRDDNPDTSE